MSLKYFSEWRCSQRRRELSLWVGHLTSGSKESLKGQRKSFCAELPPVSPATGVIFCLRACPGAAKHSDWMNGLCATSIWGFIDILKQFLIIWGLAPPKHRLCQTLAFFHVSARTPLKQRFNTLKTTLSLLTLLLRFHLYHQNIHFKHITSNQRNCQLLRLGHWISSTWVILQPLPWSPCPCHIHSDCPSYRIFGPSQRH